MGDNPRDPGKDTTRTNQAVAETGVNPGTRLIDWHAETPKTPPVRAEKNESPIRQADAPPPPGKDKADPPGTLTVGYDSAKGLDKPIGKDVVHLNIDSNHGINLATNLVHGKGIEPHFKTVIGEPGATKSVDLKGDFDLPPNLQDITLRFTDDKGVKRSLTYQASQLRLEGTANAINPYVNDFKKPDPQRPVSEQIPATNSVYEFGYKMSDMSGKALGFLEQSLVNDKAADKIGNPYIDINLAEVRVGLAMKHYINALGPYADDVKAREKGFAQTEIAEAKKNYDNAILLGQKQMSTLKNPGELQPHNHTDPMGRRFGPTYPYGEDYYPLVYGSAIDTANWRRMQLDILSRMMSVNQQLPARQSKRIDLP